MLKSMNIEMSNDLIFQMEGVTTGPTLYSRSLLDPRSMKALVPGPMVRGQWGALVPVGWLQPGPKVVNPGWWL